MTERAAVIGAGVVGLASARALARAGYETFILEAADRIASGATSRNSGVIHAGLYYAPDSLKARLCLRGRALLYEWCAAHGVSHRKTGKLVVAADAAETAELDGIERNARACGSSGVRRVAAAELRAMEPEVAGVEALHSPETGIVDPHELADSLLADAERAGATLVLRAEVTGAEAGPPWRLATSRDGIEADVVVNAGGLHADDVAAFSGASYRIHPWRGDYFAFAPCRTFRHLVYPVKRKGDPGLGVHLTIDTGGGYRLGPDAEPAASKGDFRPRQDKLDAFLAAAQKLFPWAERSMLRYDMCGIRAKLRAPGETAERDFVISMDAPGWVNLVGIESPGLTASLAIGEEVVARVGGFR